MGTFKELNLTKTDIVGGGKIYAANELARFNAIEESVDSLTANAANKIEDDTIAGQWTFSKTVLMNNDIDMNQNKVIDLAAPTNEGDAATKGYVDGFRTFFHAYSDEVQSTNSTDVIAYNGAILELSDLSEGQTYLILVSGEVQVASGWYVKLKLRNNDVNVRDYQIMGMKGSNNTVRGSGSCFTFTYLMTASESTHTIKLFFASGSRDYWASIFRTEFVAIRIQ